MKTNNAVLVLEDGTVFRGTGFGSEKESFGEIVFNTSMTGYAEYLTDPSYNGQILMPTYPLIGNYGINPEWFESNRVWVEGFVVKELCERPSHPKGTRTLDALLKEFDVPGIMGVDTRALTIKIRERGTMKSGIATYSDSPPDMADFLERVRKQPDISSLDLVAETTRKEITHFNAGGKLKVALMDFGVKANIIRELLGRGISVAAVPARSSFDQIDGLAPDGVLISNLPGDPAILAYAFETVKRLMEKYPTIGICGGNQILALAAGARTFKLKFGHRGGNHPVKDLHTGKVYITSQNHSFAVDRESLEGTGFVATKINCNDGTVEGMDHMELPVFSVQYHPEDSPGPWDNKYLFDRFVKMMATSK